MARKLSTGDLVVILEHTAATKEELQDHFQDAHGVFVPKSGNYLDIVERLIDQLGAPDARRVVIAACLAHIQPKLKRRLEEFVEEGSAYVATSDPAIVSDVFTSRGRLTALGEVLFDAWRNHGSLESLGTKGVPVTSSTSSSSVRDGRTKPSFVQSSDQMPDIEARYALSRQIGTGSFGTVWEAIDRRLGRPVAVKQLKPDASSDAVARFHRETELLAQLRHPHVVSILDRGERWFAMELGEHSLAEIEVPVRRERAVAWVRQLGAALAHAHEAGVIHRDLKPANIVLFAGGAVAKIADFGLGKDVTSKQHMTETFAMMGTRSFSAPEQFVDAKRVDHRADIYALGQILYVLITGREPEPDASGLAPASLNAAVVRATAYRATERFDNMNSFMGALSRV